MKHVLKAFALAGLVMSTPSLAREALYTVPTPEDRADLVPFAESMATSVKFELKKDRVELDYKLPLILTGGVEKRIRLNSQPLNGSRVESRIILDGDGAHGVCRPNETIPSRFDCELDYERDQLALDKTKMDAFIKSQSGTLEEEIPRLEIGDLFYNEARGILHALTLKNKIKFE